ncbi:MAG: hypothetical protein RJA22_2392 [Verrucomicrobiota bacterium]|jgi:drug/metabolite transporter (DMT)-like permease
MTKVLLILMAGLLFEAVGVVHLSAGMKQWRQAAAASPEGASRLATWGRLLQAGLTNRNLLLGIAYESVFFAVICYLLTHRDVSLIWPLSALSFVFTGLAAKFFLHEQISGLRWAGIVLIVAGAGLITLSEKRQEQPRAAAATPAGPPPSGVP